MTRSTRPALRLLLLLCLLWNADALAGIADPVASSAFLTFVVFFVVGAASLCALAWAQPHKEQQTRLSQKRIVMLLALAVVTLVAAAITAGVSLWLLSCGATPPASSSGRSGTVAAAVDFSTGPNMATDGAVTALFDYSSTVQNQATIYTALLALVDGAAADSKIHISLFEIDDDFKFVPPLLDALSRARSERNVGIFAVLDEKSKATQAFARLKSLSDSFHVCMGGCHGIKSRNHNKFVLFSAVAGRAEPVVFQSSVNWTRDQFTHLFQQALVVENTALYGKYLKYFADLNSGVHDQDYFHTSGGVGSSFAGVPFPMGIRAYFFPVATGTDPLAAAIAKTDCSTGHGEVRLANNIFSLSSTDMFDVLLRLSNKGCNVKVALRKGNGNGDMYRRIRNKAPKVHLRCVPLVHVKYVLARDSHRSLVLAGSRPMTTGWNEDDAMLRVISAPLYRAFDAHYDLLFASGQASATCS